MYWESAWNSARATAVIGRLARIAALCDAEGLLLGHEDSALMDEIVRLKAERKKAEVRRTMKPTPELNRGARIERAAEKKTIERYVRNAEAYLEGAIEYQGRLQTNIRAAGRQLGDLRRSLGLRAKRTAAKKGGVGRR